MSTKDIVYIALFAALTAALGLFPPLALPVVGVPITAQSMGAMLAGAIVGAKRGGLALLLFCVLVAIGLPVMAGGMGGFGVFLSPSGGFVLAWPIAAFVIGYLYEQNLAKLNVFKESGFLAFGGIVLVYVIGIPWVAVFANINLWQATVGSVGFIPGDIIKVILVILIAKTVRRAYPTHESHF
ncbi:biotin transporter BioY [Photorhabdus heterorhabditis]|uniref:Biotin transporter n=1 Tax=Photorhabdus heterorhabditis TaxID=880156 RepID=A0A5B0XAT9_9GAMM|nr:biotin transporter BioY [Photorhabdus heterorhabditis]KAA1195441.1 biotin transporter BioY [Photorhabdus heterorhabditis]KOY63048.1 biotin biosynthesis protein BioY [Photorhabdus heterorhabditis]MBS9441099.1 biotin transporter BioY [Photorhabdus heterorhabditis]NRN27812.1 biotin transporter BioY [Photorhabdus heterorhabditis subsp. aluminescens]